MTPFESWLAMLSVPGWIVAAGLGGALIGERARRKAAERFARFGAFDGPTATRLPDQPDPELRAMTAGRHAEANRRFSEDTIRRGTRTLIEEARAEGRSLSETAARDQAIAMLYGGFESDADLPEAGL